MKRFLLFVGEHFYPLGGFEDFVGDYETHLECCQKAQELRIKDNIYRCWMNVLDLETGKCESKGEYNEYDQIWEFDYELQ